MTQQSLMPREEAFAQEYVVDYSAKDAAIRAGYKENSAGKTANKLLKKERVQRRIDELQAERQERTRVTADWVRDKLVQNVEKAMQAEPVLDREGNETGEYKYQGSVANKALELLGRDIGMFQKEDGAGDQAGDDGKTPAQRLEEARQRAEQAQQVADDSDNVVGLHRKSDGTHG
jgi:phage terminase small subunit